MSKSRKHLMNQNTHPIPTEDQHVVRVLELRGNNQVFAEFANEEQILCLMPNKFKRKIWISKGHYIVIKQAEVNSTTKGFQIKKDDVQYLKELNIFPFKDETTKTDEEEEIEEEEEYDSDEEVEYEGNPNRISYSYSSDEDSSEDEN